MNDISTDTNVQGNEGRNTAMITALGPDYTCGIILARFHTLDRVNDYVGM
jgi:hypothetical protein